MTTIPNVLADRYATAAMKTIWAPEGRVTLEREFWIAVMKAQRDLGLDISEKAIAACERVKDRVDLESIRRREAVTRHDVKARLEEFCSLAGCERIHLGMTSRDLTENVEQLQVSRSMTLIMTRAVAVLNAFAVRASAWRDLVIASRTHNVAAQPTTLGKRMAMFGQELLCACDAFESVRRRYPLRGLKGAAGTQLDPLTLFDGNAAKVRELEARLVAHLGFERVLGAVGQVYPRSLDFQVVSALYQLGSGPSSFARTLRLMAGHEWAGEGFAKGQVGSSAMPHKMNSRSCERLNGLHAILRGHLTMAESLAGDQWNEGDVSCSVVRRVVLPDSFFALDGLLETALTVLRDMEIFPAVMAREKAHYLPFLATTTFLMEAVKAGAGREAAHEAIREHAVATVRDLRTGCGGTNDLVERLARDPRVGLTVDQLRAVLAREQDLVGLAREQVDAFATAVAAWVARYPAAAQYQPGGIL